MDGTPTDRDRGTTRLLWSIIGVSLFVHAGCVALGRTWLAGWRWESVPVHASMEMAGAIVALLVAWILLHRDFRGHGTSFNVRISTGLAGMGLLDGLHALTHVGQAFVWLHTLATFVGGLLLSAVWLPRRWRSRFRIAWPIVAMGGLLIVGVLSIVLPDFVPTMVAGQEFTATAKWLNVGGGVLLLLASVRLLDAYRRHRNEDDLLFFLHCALFGAAAIMFEQSTLWDVTWWGWHFLRFMAYSVALWFVLAADLRTSREMRALALEAARVAAIDEQKRALQVLNENLRYANSSLKDEVTNRLDAEERMASANAHLNAILASAREIAVIAVDTKGIITLFNTGAERLLGYTSDEIVGRDTPIVFHCRDEVELRSRELTRLYGRPVEGMDVFVEVCLREGHETRDWTVVRKDGEQRSVRLSTSCIQIDENLVGFLGILVDLTQQVRAEREREELHAETVLLARRAGMADTANDVLHNVGNVLNSINVSATLVAESLARSRSKRVHDVADLIAEHADDLGTFFTEDERGRRLPRYVATLAAQLNAERAAIRMEIEGLRENVDHVKAVVSAQQSVAGTGGHEEHCRIADIVDQAVRLRRASIDEYDVQLNLDSGDSPLGWHDRHKVIQILVNLLKNAVESLREVPVDERCLEVRVRRLGGDRVAVDVADTGVGIAPERLERMFAQRFSTKPDGHGFGLHASANLSSEVGGRLRAFSDGPGRGATFTLELPLDRHLRRYVSTTHYRSSGDSLQTERRPAFDAPTP